MITVIIPTKNGGEKFKECVHGIQKQSVSFTEVLVVDSGSTDNTLQIANDANFRIISISPDKFDHGTTRAMCVELANTELILFMSQDAILTDPNSVSLLISAFRDESVACAYGRQLPHTDADPFAISHREINYSGRSYVTALHSSYPKGFRKTFFSNAYGAYRKSTLIEVGNFDQQTIFGEDALAAAKLLKNGRRCAYVAEATIKHSHNYSIKEDFNRYFDAGVWQSQNQSLFTEFGSPEGEGWKFVILQTKCLYRNKNYLHFFSMILHTSAKLMGYHLGKKHKLLGRKISHLLSMNKRYFS